MMLAPGTRLGVYEIVDALGAGGMGEVYRARDSKLGRSVAVKVLPEALASDGDRIARFEREAKALAALNHPHIAQLYGLEEAPNPESRTPNHFLVMELVEGETLEQRIARGPLPLDDALTLARQIAEALEAAHEKGIVHRDLKPANVKITPDDKVKVLDFGLAKAMEPPSGVSNLTHSPTLSMMATEAGVILGTAAYMSPEQAKGLPADQRSDIFSFGVVLYEMLTGRQPFHGETAPEVLASVMIRDADLNTLPPNLNPRLLDLIKRCLHKNPKQRWQHIGDIRSELETIAADPTGASSVTSIVAAAPRPLWRRALPVAVTAIVAGALGTAVGWYVKPRAPAAVTRFSIPLAEGQQFTNTGRQVVAISPDGTRIVFVASQRLYLRSMRDADARPIAGTDAYGAPLNPVFSPDGESIVFYSAGLRRIAITGGAAVTLCQTGAPWGVSWSGDSILFGLGPRGVMRVPATGGEPETLVKVENDEVAHGPELLPDGDTVMFTLAKSVAVPSERSKRWDEAQIVTQSIRTGRRTVLIQGGSDARYLPSGHIVYAHQGVVFAANFDPKRLRLTSSAVPIVEGVRRAGGNTGSAHFSVSRTGTLVYVPGPVATTTGQFIMAIVDRDGGFESMKLPVGGYEAPRVSPDGRRLAFGSDDGKEATVWIYDLSGAAAMRRLTTKGRNRFPLWSPDGERVAFQSDLGGDLGIFWQLADGSGTAERLTKADGGVSQTPESWTPDGKHLLFASAKDGKSALWMYSRADRNTRPYGDVKSGYPVTMAVCSPDGRWFAYVSNDNASNSARVYVQPFPSTGTRYEIGGGIDPVWSRDGQELINSATPTRFVAYTITTHPSFAFAKPVQLPRPFYDPGTTTERSFDTLPSGKLVALMPADTSDSAIAHPEIRVVLDWFDELKLRVPAR